MAKTKSTKLKLDMMSVTVLLVMSIFGGIVGFYLGKSATSAQMVSFRDAATMMTEKGAMMQDAGKLMDKYAKGNREMMEKGKALMEAGSTMSGTGESMMGMMQGY